LEVDLLVDMKGKAKFFKERKKALSWLLKN